MTENEIKRAVDWYKREGSRINVYKLCLLSLAEEYLKIEEGLEEKECPLHKKNFCDSRFCDTCAIALGFNEALRLCKLAVLKDKYCECKEKPVRLISHCRNCEKEIKSPPTIAEMITDTINEEEA